jgi:hypothetical protein
MLKSEMVVLTDREEWHDWCWCDYTLNTIRSAQALVVEIEIETTHHWNQANAQNKKSHSTNYLRNATQRKNKSLVSFAQSKCQYLRWKIYKRLKTWSFQLNHWSETQELSRVMTMDQKTSQKRFGFCENQRKWFRPVSPVFDKPVSKSNFFKKIIFL